MPANKKLGPLYAAKAQMRRAMVGQSNSPESPEVKLWASVIEQAVFDAHLFRSRGDTGAILVITSARRFFDTEGFRDLCYQIGINSEWVHNMARDIEATARELRGDEYEGSLVLKANARQEKRAALRQHRLDHNQKRLFQ